MAANTVVAVRCESLRSEAELQSIDSDISSESGMSSSLSSVGSVCSVCSANSEVCFESSTEFGLQSCDGSQSSQDVRDEADSGLFCAKLHKKHRAEAAAWVKKCRKEGKNPLDT